MLVFFFFNRFSFRYNDILTYGSRKPYSHCDNNGSVNTETKNKNRTSANCHCSMGTTFAIFCDFQNSRTKMSLLSELDASNLDNVVHLVQQCYFQPQGNHCIQFMKLTAITQCVLLITTFSLCLRSLLFQSYFRRDLHSQ